MKEKRLTKYSENDKKGLIKFLIADGLVLTFHALWIPLMFAVSKHEFFFLGTCVSVASLASTALILKKNWEGINNYINSKKYAKKYLKEMEEKIECVEYYIHQAKQWLDMYNKLKNNSSTPTEFLNVVRIKAFEAALEAKMVINIHESNFKENQKYYNDMILFKKGKTLGVITYVDNFDLKPDEASKYTAKYRDLENQIKINCDVRSLDLTPYEQIITESKLKEVLLDKKAKKQKNITKTNDQAFEQ